MRQGSFIAGLVTILALAAAAPHAAAHSKDGHCDVSVTSIPGTVVAGALFDVHVSIAGAPSSCVGNITLTGPAHLTGVSAQAPQATLVFTGLQLFTAGIVELRAADDGEDRGSSAHKSGPQHVTVTPAEPVGPLYITPVAGMTLASGEAAQAAAWRDDAYGNPVLQSPAWSEDCEYAAVAPSGIVTGGLYQETCTLTATGPGGPATSPLMVTGPVPPPTPQLSTLALTAAGLGVLGLVGYARRK